MSNHTPGPWAVIPTEKSCVMNHAGTVIAACGPEGTQEAEANARLIALAPAMKTALARIRWNCKDQIQYATSPQERERWEFLVTICDGPLNEVEA